MQVEINAIAYDFYRVNKATVGNNLKKSVCHTKD